MIEQNVDKIIAVIETVRRLRAPGGCPWDRKQTHQSLRPYLIEEAYEVLDVLDKIKDDQDVLKSEIKKDFQSELGDLLMQVLLHAQMASEKDSFNFSDVADTLNEKLVRRHPHVFAGKENANWEEEKAKEKKDQPNASVLDGLPSQLPALQRAGRVIEKVTKVGFQWPDMDGPLDKLKEELSELDSAVRNLESKIKESGDEAKEVQDCRGEVALEIGDLFFSLANVAYLLKIHPEDALRACLAKFERRFRYVESQIKAQGKLLTESSLEEMDKYWLEAKSKE